MGLSLKLLGEFEVRDEAGEALALPTRKTRALLAYLAVNADKPQQRERLMTLLWSDRGEQQARHSLNQALMSIRRLGNAAGVPLLDGDGERVTLRSDAINIDLVRFRAQLDQEPADAVALCDGPFLDGLSVPDPAFENWLAATRGELHVQACEALDRATDAAAGSDETDRAIDFARRLVALDPLREHAHRRLMLLLHNIGDRAGALRQYQACADILKKELQIEPDTATKTLFEEIRRETAVPTKTEPPGAAADTVPTGSHLPLPDKPSIVVLPFSNISGDPEQEYFSDGITEDITTELSRFSELFVIARNTAFTYKGQPLNITDVAGELGVHFVLEGSVRKAGNRVRINAQLIDGQNGNHLWAERYDGSIEEVFELQDEVTRQVVGATVPHINEAELSRIRRGDRIFDRDHDLAWRALDDFENGVRLAQPALMEDAKAKAYQAIEHNERCFLAYYVICMACWRELRLQWSDDPAETLSELKRTAETYLSLAPQSHRAHLCNGLAKTNAGSTVAGVQDLRHSVELNPNDGMVQGLLAICEVQLGNLKECKEIAEKAIRINPKGRWAGAGYLALTQAAFVEDDKQFRDYADRAIKAQPNSPNRRALMIAYAAEIGDQTLLQMHLQHLNTIAPQFIPRLLSGEVDLFKIPQQREKFLSALRKAVSFE